MCSMVAHREERGAGARETSRDWRQFGEAVMVEGEACGQHRVNGVLEPPEGSWGPRRRHQCGCAFTADRFLTSHGGSTAVWGNLHPPPKQYRNTREAPQGFTDDPSREKQGFSTSVQRTLWTVSLPVVGLSCGGCPAAPWSLPRMVVAPLQLW